MATRAATRTLSRWMLSIGLALVALVGINLLLANAPAQARHVADLINCSGPIQACIDVANDGDTIFIAAGRYTESLTLSRPVSLTGENRDTTIIHAVAGQRVLTVTGATISNSVVISGLTFTGGNLSGPEYCPKRCGGGIFITDTAHLIIQNVVFSNNVASEAGGGLYADSATVALNDSQFISNTAGTLGGGAFVIGAVHLSNTHLISNTSGLGAAMDIWNGPAFITNSLFADNDAVAYGGGLLFEGTILSISNTQFIRNSAEYGQGGAVYAGSSTTLNVVRSRFDSNIGSPGTALYVDYPSLVPASIVETEIINNRAQGGGFGGAVCIFGTVHVLGGRFENNVGEDVWGGGLYAASAFITGTQFISNSSLFGGGLYASTLHMEGGRVERNTSTDQPGGGVAGFDVYLSGTVIISNVAPGGAGVFASGYELVLNHARVENNRSVGYGSNDYNYGGGIWTGGPLIISDSQILNNTAAKGGGVSLKGDGIDRSRIVNSVLAGNNATDNGAEIYIDAPGPYELIHTTIADSTLNPQPAIAVLTGTLYLTNTIIASHTIAISNTGGTVYEDYNLFFSNITNTVGVTSGGPSLIDDPKFVDPLHGNYHLQFGSAAIDHGVDAGVYTDLDGNPRPFGPGFDIGAYEYQGIRYLWLPLIRKSD